MLETFYKIKGCPASIALLTDTHDTDPEPILASLRSRQPSLIALAGDFVHGMNPQRGSKMEESKNAVELLKGCAGLAPTFVSVGNHEAYLSQVDLEIISAAGVTLLDNRYATFCIGGNKVVIGGLTSAYYTAYQQYKALPLNLYLKAVHLDGKPEPEIGWLEGYAAEDGYHILLMHHPEYIRFIPASIELVMAGHAHGGQWRFYDLFKKKWRGVYAPNQGIFPKLTGGVIDGRFVISRGLSNTAWLPRICNETEIVYIEGR